jgi:ribosomal-protein-alanine N-acetyltransferase
MMVSFAVSRSGNLAERCAVKCQNFLTPADNPGTRTAAVGRRARPADLAALVELDRACFGRRAWSARAWREAVTAPQWITVVIERNGEIVAASVLIPDGPRASLASIAVASRWRRQGLGRVLVRDAIGRARAASARWLSLEVDRANRGAVELYRREGFTVSRRFWEDGCWRQEMLHRLGGAHGRACGLLLDMMDRA